MPHLYDYSPPSFDFISEKASRASADGNNGSYDFTDVMPGDYTVTEDAAITVSSSTIVGNNADGGHGDSVAQQGNILIISEDGDSYEDSEPGLAGVTVYLDVNQTADCAKPMGGPGFIFDDVIEEDDLDGVSAAKSPYYDPDTACTCEPAALSPGDYAVVEHHHGEVVNALELDMSMGEPIWDW